MLRWYQMYFHVALRYFSVFSSEFFQNITCIPILSFPPLVPLFHYSISSDAQRIIPCASSISSFHQFPNFIVPNFINFHAEIGNWTLLPLRGRQRPIAWNPREKLITNGAHLRYVNIVYPLCCSPPIISFLFITPLFPRNIPFWNFNIFSYNKYHIFTINFSVKYNNTFI